MADFLDALAVTFSGVVQISLQASVLAALILIVQRLLRKRLAPRWHYALWLLVLVRLFLPWTPESPTSLFNYVRTEQAAPVVMLRSEPAAEFPTMEPIVIEPTPMPGPSWPDLSPAPAVTVIWADGLRLGWLAVALLLCLYICGANAVLWWRVRREPRIGDGPVAVAFAACKEQMGVRAPIRLVRTRQIATPALLGLFRPRLLLPETMEPTLSREELRHVFLHELAHYRRGDLLANWLMVACNIVHWFNPALWYAFHRMRADRELACDALAMSYIAPDDTSSYGRTLLRLLEHVARPQPLPGLVGVLERRSHLKKRIRGIAGFRPGSYRWSILAVSLIAVLSAVALTSASTKELKSETPLPSAGQQLTIAAAPTETEQALPANIEPLASDMPNGIRGTITEDRVRIEPIAEVVAADTVPQEDLSQKVQDSDIVARESDTALTAADGEEAAAKGAESGREIDKYLDEMTVTIRLEGGTTVTDVAEKLAELAQLNILVDRRVAESQDGSRSSPGDWAVKAAQYNDTPLLEVLRTILEPLGLSLSVQSSFIWISTPDRIATESFDELETRTYSLDRIPALMADGASRETFLATIRRIVRVAEPVTGKTLSRVVVDDEDGALVVYSAGSYLDHLESLILKTIPLRVSEGSVTDLNARKDLGVDQRDSHDAQGGDVSNPPVLLKWGDRRITAESGRFNLDTQDLDLDRAYVQRYWDAKDKRQKQHEQVIKGYTTLHLSMGPAQIGRGEDFEVPPNPPPRKAHDSRENDDIENDDAKKQPAHVEGTNVSISADSMVLDMDTHEIYLAGHVNGSLAAGLHDFHADHLTINMETGAVQMEGATIGEITLSQNQRVEPSVPIDTTADAPDKPLPPSPSMLAALEKPVSFEFHDAHIATVAATLISLCGIAIELDNDAIVPKGSTSADKERYPTDGMIPYVKLEHVPLKDALKALLRPLGLAFEVRGDTIRVSTPERLGMAPLSHGALTVGVAGRPNLTGTIYDEDESPWQGAVVCVYTAKPRTGPSLVCPSCYADCAKRVATDVNGKFTIPSVDPTLLFRVLVIAEGYRPQLIEDVDPLEGPVRAKLVALDPARLKPGHVLRGRVLDPLGQPVVGAKIEPYAKHTGNSTQYGGLRGIDPVSATNQSGDFLITCEDVNVVLSVEVEARGLAPKKFMKLAAGEARHELNLGYGATVKGKVEKDGKPVPNILMGIVQTDRNAQSFLGEIEIGTDDAGRFVFTNVPPNDAFAVYGQLDDAAAVGAIPVTLLRTNDDESVVDVGTLTVEAGHRLSGRIVLSDGKPLPDDLRVMISREVAWDWLQVEVGKDGRFEAVNLPSEEYRINCRIPGYHLSTENFSFHPLDQSSLMRIDQDITDLTLLLEPGDRQ